MELISAREAYNLTIKNLEKTAIKQVMKQINTACINGQFKVTLFPDFSPNEIRIVETVFTELGYKVSISKEKYVGSLKERNILKISWI